MIGTAHDLAVKPPPPGTPVMRALPDDGDTEARRRQGVAQVEMTLAAPFVAIGTAMLALAAAPLIAGGEAVEDSAVAANAGAKVIPFERYLRVARAAGTAGAAASAADKLAAQPAEVPQPTAPGLTPGQQRQWDAYQAWDDQQRYQSHQEKHYLLWPDAPGSMP